MPMQHKALSANLKALKHVKMTIVQMENRLMKAEAMI